MICTDVLIGDGTDNGGLMSNDEVQEFMEIVYRALMMVARWIERRYLKKGCAQ